MLPLESTSGDMSCFVRLPVFLQASHVQHVLAEKRAGMSLWLQRFDISASTAQQMPAIRASVWHKQHGP